MSSLVAELLQSSGELTKEDISLKVDQLKIKFEDINLEIKENLKNRYVDFLPQCIELDKLIESIQDLTKEYDCLYSYVQREVKPQMVNSVVELNDVVEELKKIKKLKEIALNISLQHNCLEDAKRLLSQDAFLKSAHCLVEFESYNNIDFEYKNDISIASALRIEFITVKEDLIYHIENAFNKIIVISSSLEGRKKSLSFEIDKTVNVESNSDLFRALKLMKHLSHTLKVFGKRFLNIVCENVVSNIVKLSRSEDSPVLTITIIKEHIPDPTDVFEVLKQIFSFLYESILKLSVSSTNDETGVLTGMAEFGMVVSEEFCSLVIEKCLKIAVPKKSEKMDTFINNITAAQNFCNYLKEIHFLESSNCKLDDFIHDVDILPVNKIAQDFLRRSRSCMKKSLYQTVTVGIKETTEETNNLDEMVGIKNALSKSTFSFPQCQISESMQEIMSLLHEVKNEAKNIGDEYAPRLYYVARSICELYCCVVPVYHKEEINNIPQQTAIFHNNCMYLAHQLYLLSSSYEVDLQLSIQITFVDLVPEIRKLGVDSFLAQMRQQKQQLLQLLKDQECGSILIDDGAVNKAEKAIRQCLCQLQLLKKVWSDVLPVHVYFKAIGTLLNTCLEEMITHISSMEDIAAEASAQLDTIFDILIKQGPELFWTSSTDKRNFVHLFVRKWFKFQELQLILSATMREIVDRWASGKGPLATHFTSEEVKHLIRALFQNTERRAAALAKIR